MSLETKWKIKAFNNTINLYRGLHEMWIIDDKISSAAFKDEECSVNRSDLASAQETIDQNIKWKGVGELNSQYPIELGLFVVHSPQLNNQAHTIIRGRKTKSISKRLSKETRLILMR